MGGETPDEEPPGDPGGDHGDNLAPDATATASSSASGYTPSGAIDKVIPVYTTPGDEWASSLRSRWVQGSS